MNNIMVFLKIKDRGIYNNKMLDCLSLWIEGCNKLGLKYIISTGDYTGSLPSSCPQEIINNNFFTTQVIGQEIKTLVDNSICEKSWYPAAYVHCLPYFYSKEDITINIDADDIYHSLNKEELLQRIINKFIEQNSITLSYDVYFSVSIRPESRPHHWSFGINISNTIKMEQIIRKALKQQNLPQVGFCNIDYLVDYYLEHNTTGSIAMITKDGYFDHCGRIEYIPDTDQVCLTYQGDITIKPRHSRTEII